MSAEIDRRESIAELARAAPRDHARIAGRIVSVDRDRVRIEEDGAAILVETALVEGRAPLGAWVLAEGDWDGSVLRAAAIEILQEARAAFPQVSGEWVRLHDGGGRRALERRAALMRAIRAFFDGRGFLEVETPAMVPSPGLDLHLDPFAVAGAREERWLITSPEYQMKRLLVGGLSRIYQLARCFRRGERGPRHEPEFTMLEWYRALSSAEAIMRDTEECVAHCARSLCGTTRLARADGGVLELAPPWDRMTVEEALRAHAGIAWDDIAADEERFFLVLTEIEPRLGRERPVFLTEWPAPMASLARLIPGTDRAERFEAFVSGIELSNGFGELTDPIEQRARLERDRAARAARGLATPRIDERFLAALEEGMPPSGGNALGFERLLMLLIGEVEIDRVLAFGDARL